MSSVTTVTTQSKASVAIICKIVPNSIDQSTLDDYVFLNNCHKKGVAKAKLPKPLNVFHSHNALRELGNQNAMVLLTTCCGPGVTMLDANAQVSQDTTLRGVYSETMWLQYLR